MTEPSPDRLALIEAAPFEVLRILTPAEAAPVVAHRIVQRMDQRVALDDVIGRIRPQRGEP
jgi:hypothetical protein